MHELRTEKITKILGKRDNNCRYLILFIFFIILLIGSLIIEQLALLRMREDIYLCTML